MEAPAEGGEGVLTSWEIIKVTTPLGLIRAITFRVMPLVRLLTVLVNREVPPLLTPETACEERVGTSSPTLRVAMMLSVAIKFGAAMVLACPALSCAVSRPSSSRL